MLEVVLAISIAIGVLVVALYFYAQAAELRTQLLLESERISSARRIMDRITEDLRCAYGTFAAGSGVTGDSASLRIVRTELPPRSLWTAEQAARVAQPVTDLRLVIYSTGISTNGTNVVETTNAAMAGLFRSEEPLVQKRQTRPPPGAAPLLSATPPETRPGPEPLTEAIQFVNLRYWDGSSWQDSWNKGVLPQGVEVSLGGEPL
ncbi:MAG: hypothetical protein NTW03_22050, partial [Verrucomicrobia bacterium]|nr:hypothetical protein [Verrucomicrobiota bacterium]